MTELIEQKQLNNIATWMISIRETNLPSILKGVFFLDGNPVPDTCITMYNLEWNAQNRTLVLPVFAPLQWTFHNSIPGWITLRFIQLFKLTYKLQFEDETLQQAKIIPILLGIPISTLIANFTMTKIKILPMEIFGTERMFGSVVFLGLVSILSVGLLMKMAVILLLLMICLPGFQMSV